MKSSSRSPSNSPCASVSKEQAPRGQIISLKSAEDFAAAEDGVKTAEVELMKKKTMSLFA